MLRGQLLQPVLELIEFLLLVLRTQPLEQFHKVLTLELLVEVGTHIPHAPSTLYVRPKWWCPCVRPPVLISGDHCDQRTNPWINSSATVRCMY